MRDSANLMETQGQIYFQIHYRRQYEALSLQKEQSKTPFELHHNHHSCDEFPNLSVPEKKSGVVY